MLNEKFIDPNSLRAKLDQLNYLPGDDDNIDKDVAWENLDKRLRSGRSNKKALWYWVAAACIPAFLFIWRIQQNTPDENTVQSVVQKELVPVNKEINKAILGESDIPSMASKKSSRKNKIDQHPSIKANNQAQPLIADKTTVVAAINKDSITTSPLASNEMKPKPVLYPVLKKTLPVVHINELDQSLQPPATMAKNSNRPSLKERFLNRESQESQSSYSPGGNILTIKLSPQN